MGNKTIKQGFLARDLVIAVILFGVIMTIIFAAVTDFGTNYGKPTIIGDDFKSRYDKINNQTQEISSSMFDAVGSGEGLTLVGTFNTIFSGTFNVIKLVLNSVGISTTMINNASEDLGIPSSILTILTGGLAAIIIVIIVMGVISFLGRGRI